MSLPNSGLIVVRFGLVLITGGSQVYILQELQVRVDVQHFAQLLGKENIY
jgi:hypothetical protein